MPKTQNPSSLIPFLVSFSFHIQPTIKHYQTLTFLTSNVFEFGCFFEILWIMVRQFLDLRLKREKQLLRNKGAAIATTQHSTSLPSPPVAIYDTVMRIKLLSAPLSPPGFKFIYPHRLPLRRRPHHRHRRLHLCHVQQNSVYFRIESQCRSTRTGAIWH